MLDVCYIIVIAPHNSIWLSLNRETEMSGMSNVSKFHIEMQNQKKENVPVEKNLFIGERKL